MAVARWLLPVPDRPPDHVVRRLSECRLGQLCHQLAVYRRDLEVKARQAPMYREFRRVHLMADRARGTVGRLGAQHLLDQPA